MSVLTETYRTPHEIGLTDGVKWRHYQLLHSDGDGDGKFALYCRIGTKSQAGDPVECGPELLAEAIAITNAHEWAAGTSDTAPPNTGGETMTDDEVAAYVRRSAKGLTGSSMTFVIDEIDMMAVLAEWALDNGFPRDQMSEAFRSNLSAAAAKRNAAPDMLEALERAVAPQSFPEPCAADFDNLNEDMAAYVKAMQDEADAIYRDARAIIARVKGGAA